TLAALATASDEAPLRAFELLLLRETGVLPELDRGTASQQAVDPDRRYRLEPESGLMAAPANGPALSGSQWQALQGALDARSPSALRVATQPVLDALKPQLRALLHYHLGTAHLRTRQAMIDVRRLLESSR
ncbi:MAG: DNA repair protein RecO C-terminal domain-containing protein, partial [Burkholderiales bacterium]|nr:DNA repair protein RecO C-terminal domain-containing protein [Burkholderiales bacterium]